MKDVGYESYELANHPEIGGMGAVEKKEETVNSFIRRKCTLRSHQLRKSEIFIA